jgi:hypothetical protein
MRKKRRTTWQQNHFVWMPPTVASENSHVLLHEYLKIQMRWDWGTKQPTNEVVDFDAYLCSLVVISHGLLSCSSKGNKVVEVAASFLRTVNRPLPSGLRSFGSLFWQHL